jgi:hypothetical protein
VIADHAREPTHSPERRDPGGQWVGAAVARPRAPALTADGEIVAGEEMEAAAEFAQMPRRFGLMGRAVDGFRLYRLYRALRRVWWATSRQRGGHVTRKSHRVT